MTLDESRLPKEFHELMADLLDGRIDDDRHARLMRMVEEDAACRECYVEQMVLQSLLILQHGETSPPVAGGTATGKAPGGRSPVLGFLGDAFQAGANFLSRSFVLTLLLAIGLPGVVLLVLLVDIARQPVATVPAAAAEINRSYQAVWGEGSAGMFSGRKLSSDQRLHLREGLAEIRFANGAEVLLEGPAEFRVVDANRGFLREGTLTARVPEAAQGFAIDTPLTTVVDLGTEFGVLVAPDGQAEAHVFVGQVEVAVDAGAAQGGPITRHFHAGEAVKVRAGEPGKPPQMVAMAAASERFVRRMYEDLPQPTIVFAHRGSNDPVREGWGIQDADLKRLGKAGIEVGPVDEGGVPAWSVRTRQDNQVVYYSIEESEGLTPELIAEAKQKGWVLRARVWMSDKNPVPPKKWLGIASLSYRDGERGWTLRPSVDTDGNQSLDMLIGENVVIPIPGSRNRYVDYEIRCYPATKRVDVFVNGRRVATRSLDSTFMNLDDPRDGAPQIRFGGWRPRVDARFALVEWGIIRDLPDSPRPSVDDNE